MIEPWLQEVTFKVHVEACCLVRCVWGRKAGRGAGGMAGSCWHQIRLELQTTLIVLPLCSLVSCEDNQPPF